jgi:hypothetical protein
MKYVPLPKSKIMTKKKINFDEIDESLIISSIKNDKSSVPENPERLLTPASIKPVEQSETVIAPKEEVISKKTSHKEYESLFIRESDLPPARFGKSVYIRKEYHDRISQIISVIGANEVSLFGYIDNVLTHHFDNFSEKITQSFKKNMFFK